jgi:hypothetical protein
MAEIDGNIFVTREIRPVTLFPTPTSFTTATPYPNILPFILSQWLQQQIDFVV